MQAQVSLLIKLIVCLLNLVWLKYLVKYDFEVLI